MAAETDLAKARALKFERVIGLNPKANHPRMRSQVLLRSAASEIKALTRVTPTRPE
jgi:hypothetical protein